MAHSASRQPCRYAAVSFFPVLFGAAHFQGRLRLDDEQLSLSFPRFDLFQSLVVADMPGSYGFHQIGVMAVPQANQRQGAAFFFPVSWLTG